MVSPRGELLFANPAMRALLPEASSGATFTNMVAPDHPLRRLVEQTLLSRRSLGPISAMFEEKGGRESGERLIITHAVTDPAGELVGVMIIARNLEYLGQVQSTIRYSRKLAALGRLSAGVAHEVKNPLNAMMIHLELLRQQFVPSLADRGRRGVGARARRPPVVTAAPPPVDRTAALQHVDVIAGEIRRLDEVVQGFLKFTRPEDLKLQPVRLAVAVRRGRADPPAGSDACRRHRRRRLRRRSGHQRRSGDAAPGLSQSRDQRLPGDARRRHAADSRGGRPRPPRRRSRSPIPASGSIPSTCSGFSTCISRPSRRAAA